MKATRKMPKESGLDHTAGLLKEGYQFIPNRIRKLQSDIFETRLLGQKTIIMSGEEAAKVFYDEAFFVRKSAVPLRIQKSLLGVGSIMTMDDQEHKHRKAMHMSFMTMPRLKMIAELASEQWQAAAREWTQQNQIVLFDEARKVMLRVACRWAGVPLKEEDAEERAAQFGAMIDSFGAVGPRHWKGRIARDETEAWIRKIIRLQRTGFLQAPEESPLAVIARHKELDGRPFSTQIAAVELINILRPIVAIARFVLFGAMAMLANPETRERLATGEETYAYMFTQEVRRFYPFAPFTGARVRRDFTWRGYRFKKGTLTFLDIYGMNHDPQRWQDPHLFIPERFRNWTGTPFDFIPQGGGDHYLGHRCAGEWVTIEVMRESLAFLAGKIDYDVPPQDLHMRMNRMPTLPKSRFIMTNIRMK